MAAKLPEPSVYTSAPMRNSLRVRLDASIDDVWALVGDHARLPEYSAGIETVATSGDGQSFTCRFRATDQTPALELTQQIRWEIPGVGYSASTVEPNGFLLTDDLGVVTVKADGAGTVVEWAQYYHSSELAAAIASFDEGLTDIAQQLVARFGGQVTKQWAQDSSDTGA
jgi:carbon monoxide dehydrogenase subunit G